MTKKTRLLVLGASGMLGSVIFEKAIRSEKFSVIGQIRNPLTLNHFSAQLKERTHIGVDVLKDDQLLRLFDDIKPNLVINCVGIIKQSKLVEDPLLTIPINSVLPHRLAKLCNQINARLIQISTDCVFDGENGRYTELDTANANDLYGRSKLLGEIGHQEHVTTIRTSIIGRELTQKKSLLEWFLAQKSSVFGYTNAIFSGLPTNELAEIILDLIAPDFSMSGLYHVSADPISKYDLLQMIKETYQLDVAINPSSSFKIDRSLDCTKFKKKTGYVSKNWEQLVRAMYNYQYEQENLEYQS